MIDSIRQGFSTLNLRPEWKQAALTSLQLWSSEPRFAAYRPYIEHLNRQQAYGTLLDSFYQTLPFGTGGRRGAVGVGPNRINPHTLGTSVQGHVLYLRQRFGEDARLSVVIAWDVRRFLDLRGQFTGVAGPLTGLTSRDLGMLAARIYTAAGMQAHLLAPGDGSYLSTPELSFLIRELGAQGGLNVSASHNHPDDNGGKFYNQLGGQEIPPDDEEMARIVEQVQEIRLGEADEGAGAGKMIYIDEELRRRYRRLNRDLLPHPASRSARIVFTPLHGTGSTTVLPVLREVGYPVEVEPTQATFDGAFPAVPFRIPNPEVDRSMDRAKLLAQSLGADLVLSTDPDADRLGLLAPDEQGNWQALSGNETATLLLHHLLQKERAAGRLPAGPGQFRPFVVTTWVTTSMLERLCQAAGAACVSTLPVGFKYIAHVLRCIEEQGEYEEQGWGRTLYSSLDRFLMAAEESYGFLVTRDVRDKDACGAALLLAELASVLHDRGETLPGLLGQLQLQHGVVENLLVSMILQGAPGLEKITAIQDSLRRDPPREIAGSAVKETIDWYDEQRFGPFRSGTDRSARNVLCFVLEDGARITLRPSGTEPKNKTYVEATGQPLPAGAGQSGLQQERARLKERVRSLADGFVQEAMSRVGIDLPLAALRISDLVPVEERLRVVQEVVPRLVPALEALVRGEESVEGLRAWLDDELRRCGSDPRGLVAEGVLAGLQQLQVPAELIRLAGLVLEG